MNRTRRENRDLPHQKPVERVVLSEKHFKLRLAAALLLAVLGIGSLIYSFLSFLGAEEGWTVINANVTQGTHLGSEFTFQYCLGTGAQTASEESKAVTALYTDALVKAYQLFENIEQEGIPNLFYINRHPNEEAAVDAVLYRALEKYAASGDRMLYLGPVYEQYSNLFLCESDWQTYDFDPLQNPELAEEFGVLAAYAADSGKISLEFPDEGSVRLRVSDDYLQFAAENGIESFIDFSWMKNAFVVDYLAETMAEGGYTRGCISSYDGFVRTLDESGTDYSFPVYDRRDGRVCQAAVMHYSGPQSIVCLRSFVLNSLDAQHYYEMEDGQVRTAYLDVRDGLCRSAADNFTACSGELGCVDLLVQTAPVYIADEINEEEIPAHSVYCLENTLYCSSPELVLTDLYGPD